MDDLVQEFLNEASESLLELDSQLVELEGNPNNPDLINNIFRVMHTIKGTCGFIGLSRLEKVAHISENLLDKFRDGAPVTSGAVTIILSALDTIKEIISGIEESDGVEPKGNDAMLIDMLNDLTEEASKSLQSAKDSVEIEHEKTNNNILLSEVSSEKKNEEKGLNLNTPVSSPSSNQTVRISVTLLDSLMDLVGELVLSRNQIQQIERNINVSELSVPVQNLSHVASELQESVMKTRMQPIGVAFKAYPRIIRDLASDLGKKIKLEQIGEDTEMDRQILELIKDPLTHMVRNCADHALETPEERVTNGKTESGTITLQAYHEGGHIIIKIKDDGRGIPVEKVASKAIEKGIITKEQLELMTPNQIQGLIFKAGFSTAEKVTSVSGRGVGMDVVKTNIEKIGGTISLESIEGKGTSFIIKIPLTLAIVSAFIVETGHQKFAIPQINVVEIINLGQNADSHRVENINGIPMLRLREKIYPMVSLGNVIGEPSKSEDTVLVCQVGSDVFGILVDGVLDTEEIVVKPLSRALQELELYSGNTILGDGSVIMILDPNGLYGTFGMSNNTDLDDVVEVGNAWESADVIQMLVFTAGNFKKKAVHLAVVARLEQVKTSAIKRSGGKYLVQYREGLMPIVCVEGWEINESKEYQSIIVFDDNGRSMGLVVGEIVEIIETSVSIDIASDEPGSIGSAIIGEEACDIIDVSHYLQMALGDWFQKTNSSLYGLEGDYTVLLVDDSQFFRNMLSPMISSRGYNIHVAKDPLEGLKVLNSVNIDVLVSDIEMPEMDGLEFIKQVRKIDKYKKLPSVAVSSHATEEDVKRGLSAGFDDYMPKMDKDNLFQFLKRVTTDRNIIENKRRS